MNDFVAVVLAAGAGTRLKSKKPKVAHEILGKPLVNWAIDAARDAGAKKVVTVVGVGKEQVIPIVESSSDVVVQDRQLGTAHAVQCAMTSNALKDYNGSVVILSGDSPLIKPETISELASTLVAEDAGAVVLTMHLDDPFGYGRVVCEGFDTQDGDIMSSTIVRIVEQKDATAQEARITECNSGIYCFNTDLLRDALSKIGNDNAQGEYYLTDALEIIRDAGAKTVALECTDPDECRGVNSRKQLAEAITIKQAQINDALMENGVTMIDPSAVWCGPDVKIERDVTIYPNVIISGHVEIDEDTEILPATTIRDSKIGSGCTVGPNTRLFDTVVANGCLLDETVALESTLDDKVTCGPRAYLRPLTHMCEGSKAGTHVEIKKSTIGKGSKVPHLSYMGDTTMGEGVNIGAGSITCNYDGTNKHQTVIGDEVFVGSDTMIVAPVEIGNGCFVGAGSVITKDIPADSLAVARAKERIIEDWAKRRRMSK